jgi:hypothetical protein
MKEQKFQTINPFLSLATSCAPDLLFFILPNLKENSGLVKHLFQSGNRITGENINDKERNMSTPESAYLIFTRTNQFN